MRNPFVIESLESRRMFYTTVTTWVTEPSPPTPRVSEPVIFDGQIVMAYDNKLLSSDATEVGTRVICELPDAVGNGWDVGGETYYPAIANLNVVGNRLFFTAKSAGKGVELWRSDGTEEGTVLVKDINPGEGSAFDPSRHRRWATLGNRVFFIAEDETNGWEVWTSDGSAAGTRRISTVESGNDLPSNLVTFDGGVYFTAAGKLHKVNGAATAAAAVTGAIGYEVTEYTVGGGKMLVRTSTSNGLHRTMYVLDSSGNVTTLGEFSNGSRKDGLDSAYLSGRFYFRAAKYENGFALPTGEELWSTDGTASGTKLVKEFVAGKEDAGITQFRAFNKRLYFTARNTDGRWWFWRSDGTAEGTGALEPVMLNAKSQSVMPGFGQMIDGKLHYTVHAERVGESLAWTSLTGDGSKSLLRTDYRLPHTHATWYHDSRDVDRARVLAIDQNLMFAPGYGQMLHAIGADGAVSSFSPLGPTAMLDSPTITAAGQKIYTFRVVFDGRMGGSISLHDRDSSVYVKGPKGFVRYAAVVGVDSAGLNQTDSGIRRTVTYAINAPGGTWNSADRGRYSIGINQGYVRGGNVPVTARILGRFKVIGADSSGAVISGRVLRDQDADAFSDLPFPGIPGGSVDSPRPAGTQVFIDRDHDGVRDSGELSTVTDAEGYYRFDGLDEGVYNVRTVRSETHAQSNSSTVTVRAGEWARTDVLLAEYGTLGGTVFDDRNDNSVNDAGDAPLAGVTVLLDRNRDGRRDDDELVAVTDGSGAYQFKTFAGRYGLELIDGLGGRSITSAPENLVANVVGQDSLSNHFGVTGSAEVRVFVFHDRNANSVADPREYSVANQRPFVDLNGDGILQPTEPYAKTDDSGSVIIRGIPAGTYMVRVATSGDWVASEPGLSMTFASGRRVDTTTYTPDVKLGAWLPTIIEGIAFQDLNADGVFDSQEPGLSRYVVFADLNYNGVAEAGEPTTTTSEKGSYRLVLRPGTYLVRPQTGGAWWVSSRDVEMKGASGVTNTRKLGLTDAARLRGTLYLDTNRNGKFDSGEDGDDLGARIYVDIDGNRSFENGEPTVSRFTFEEHGSFDLRLPGLANGTYTLRIAPEDFVPTKPAEQFHVLKIKRGSQLTGMDFFLAEPA